MYRTFFLFITYIWLGVIIAGAGTGYARTAPAMQVQPTYMSLRANKIHMRVGPGKMYPIIWTYILRGLPVEVIAQHNGWLRVRDMDGETGWIYGRLLSSVRTAIVTHDNVFLHYHPDNNSGVVARLMKMVVVLPTTCRTTWCRVSVPQEKETVKGWVRKQYLWGVTPSDIFEE